MAEDEQLFNSEDAQKYSEFAAGAGKQLDKINQTISEIAKKNSMLGQSFQDFKDATRESSDSLKENKDFFVVPKVVE